MQRMSRLFFSAFRPNPDSAFDDRWSCVMSYPLVAPDAEYGRIRGLLANIMPPTAELSQFDTLAEAAEAASFSRH